MGRRKQKWSELTRGQRVLTIVTGVVQLALAAAAWTDLARRDADEVNGTKAMWGAVIGVNVVGPLAYFAAGRKRPAPEPVDPY